VTLYFLSITEQSGNIELIARMSEFALPEFGLDGNEIEVIYYSKLYLF